MEDHWQRLEREVGEVVRAAVKFAEDSPFPARSDLHADVLQE